MEPSQDASLIAFEQLPMTQPLSEQLIAQMDTLCGSGWQDNCQCITALRSINRFWPEQIVEVLSRYINNLCDMIATGKTQVLKNVFVLLREVFARGRQLNVEKIVRTFVGLLLKKVTTEHGHLKQLANEALDEFVSNCGYDSSFVSTRFKYLVIAEYTTDKHVAVSEAAIRLLARLLQNLGAGIGQLRPETLQKLMKALVFLIDGKRQSNKNWGLDICMFMYNLVGSGNYFNLMSYTLTPEELKSMSDAMNSYKKGSTTKNVPALATVLKDHRKSKVCMKQHSENYSHQGNFENYNVHPNMQQPHMQNGYPHPNQTNPHW